jgi:hypothetical protein
MKEISITVLALALAGCVTSNEPPPTLSMKDETVFGMARTQITRDAKDPDAVKIGPNMWRKTASDVGALVGGGFGPQDLVCGTVNGKNSYGAYVGFHHFMYNVGTFRLWIDSAGDEGSTLSAAQKCA